MTFSSDSPQRVTAWGARGFPWGSQGVPRGWPARPEGQLAATLCGLCRPPSFLFPVGCCCQKLDFYFVVDLMICSFHMRLLPRKIYHQGRGRLKLDVKAKKAFSRKFSIRIFPQLWPLTSKIWLSLHRRLPHLLGAMGRVARAWESKSTLDLLIAEDIHSPTKPPFFSQLLPSIFSLKARAILCLISNPFFSQACPHASLLVNRLTPERYLQAVCNAYCAWLVGSSNANSP